MKAVSWWNRYVDFWREREAPDAYALARMVWGAVVLANLVHQMISPGVLELYALPEHGGVWTLHKRPSYSLFQFLDPTASVVWGIVITGLVAALALIVGLGTRAAALVLMVVNMTLVGRLSLFGFGGDTVYSVFSFLVVLCPMGASWSVDAWLFGAGRAHVSKWPRRLVIAQLTFLYVKTGLVKAGSQWSFSGGFSALYYALNDPSYTRFHGAWTAWAYPLLQVGAFVTRLWETVFFLLPWSMYLRRPSARRGWLRRTLGRYDLRIPFLGIGAIMHLTLFVTMDLGMFPWVTMSTYVFFVRPHEARWLLERTFGAARRGVPESSPAPDGSETVRAA